MKSQFSSQEFNSLNKNFNLKYQRSYMTHFQQFLNNNYKMNLKYSWFLLLIVTLENTL
jgi:hypothetical protein